MEPIQPGPTRGTGFWILIFGGCAVVGGLALAVVVFAAGLWAGLTSDSPSTVPAAAPAAGEVKTEAPAAPAGPDDFVYRSPNGLQYIAPNAVVAEGVAVTLAGEWRDDHRSIAFRLHDNGRYELAVGGGALSGRTRSDLVASSSAEQGTWKLDGSVLTLTPEGGDTSGLAERKTSSGSLAVDPPRQWSLIGVTIEYTPHGATAPKQRAGLRIHGPGPSWHYPRGEWNFLLRKAW